MASMINYDEDGSGQVRSKRYPQISLEQAVKKARALYDADKTAGTPHQAVWPHIGYKGRSGPASGALAAMKRFGLVELRGTRLHLTPLAINILLLPPADLRRQAALKEAVQMPELYRALIEQYQDSGLPSEQSLQHELALSGDFNHNIIPSLVRDFIASLKFAGLSDESGVLLRPGKPGNGGGEDDDDESPSDEGDKHKRTKVNVVSSTKEDVYSLPEGNVVLQWPENISADGAQDLEDWLQLVLRKIKRSAVNLKQPQGGGEST